MIRIKRRNLYVGMRVAGIGAVVSLRFSIAQGLPGFYEGMESAPAVSVFARETMENYVA